MSIRSLAKSALQRVGVLSPAAPASVRGAIPEADDLDLSRLEQVRPYTMTSVERLWALRSAIKYVVRRRVPGCFVETGVWRGGSSMMAALTLLDMGETDRDLWLYDTFQGMPRPAEIDRMTVAGTAAQTFFDEKKTGDDSSDWCLASQEDVRRNLASTGYAADRIRFVVGKTQETLVKPSNRPDQIAVLRMDTDWYESTSAELANLFDRVAPGGVVIIDDYGYWAGAMKAVDEFFAAQKTPYLFNRIDETGRMMVKL